MPPLIIDLSMRIPAFFFIGLCLIISASCLVSASSVMVVVFEQSDKTALIPDAIVSANGTIVGKTGMNGEFNMSYEGNPPVIMVSKVGYNEWAGTPTLNNATLLVPLGPRNNNLTVEVYNADNISPIKKYQISISGEDGSVYDGMVKTDGSFYVPLKSGQDYTLRIRIPDNRQILNTTDSDKGKITDQYQVVKNEPFSLIVTDSISSKPISGAIIRIDGQSAGVTDQRGLVNISTGRNQEHSLNIETPGYEPYHQNRTITEQDRLVVIPLIKGNNTTVFVSVYDKEDRPVSGAGVLIDGISYGLTNQYGRLMIPELETKSHEFGAFKEGYSNVSVSEVPGSNMGEVVLVLNTVLSPEKKEMVIYVKDQTGSALSNATVSIIEEISQQRDSKVTGSNGSVNFAVEKNITLTVSANRERYYPNTTKIHTDANQFTIYLNPQNMAEIASTPVNPLIFAFITIILILLIVGGVILVRGKNKSVKKRRISRRRSL